MGPWAQSNGRVIFSRSSFLVCAALSYITASLAVVRSVGPSCERDLGSSQTQPRLCRPFPQCPVRGALPPTETAPLSYLCSDASVSMKRATSSRATEAPTVPLASATSYLPSPGASLRPAGRTTTTETPAGRMCGVAAPYRAPAGAPMASASAAFRSAFVLRRMVANMAEKIQPPTPRRRSSVCKERTPEGV